MLRNLLQLFFLQFRFEVFEKHSRNIREIFEKYSIRFALTLQYSNSLRTQNFAIRTALLKITASLTQVLRP